MSALALVSAVITTRNEEINIKSCLDSVKSQSYPSGQIEIIVVDNGSQDKTKEIASLYTDKIFNYGPERSAQRNFGIKQSTGKYILYLDADMILSPEVLSDCVSECENKNYIACYIPERIIGKGFWIKVRDFERSFYNATVIDCVRFLRKDKFLDIGGFDESLTGPEDWDFDKRVRAIGAVNIIDAPIYHNERTFKLREYIRKKIYYSNSFQAYKNKWGAGDPDIKKQLGFWYRGFGVFIENGKFFKMIKHPILASALFILRLNLAIGYIFRKR